MTKNELMHCIKKYEDQREMTRVQFNKSGHKAFSDTRGIFYIVGMLTRDFIRSGKVSRVYMASVARVPSGHSRDVNIEHLEVVGE